MIAGQGSCPHDTEHRASAAKKPCGLINSVRELTISAEKEKKGRRAKGCSG